MDKPVPIPDRFSSFHWEGAARGELLIQRVLTNIVDAAPDQLRAGDPLEVTFEARGDVALPRFRPARGGGQA